MWIEEEGKKIPICECCEVPMWYDTEYYDFDGVLVCPNCVQQFIDDNFLYQMKWLRED